jgi:peptidoglycan hydrolase-like protein with peptidoglycan-binding domain
MSKIAQSTQTVVWLTIMIVASLAVGIVIGARLAHAGDADFRLQRELNRQGCDAGDPDGIIGEQTRQAIRCFQRKVGLEVTGEATGRTLRYLFGGPRLGTPPAADDILSGGIIGLHTERPQCGDYIEASAIYLGEDRATRKAWEAWASLVVNKEELGIRFANPMKAADKSVECYKARPTD